MEKYKVMDELADEASVVGFDDSERGNNGTRRHTNFKTIPLNLVRKVSRVDDDESASFSSEKDLKNQKSVASDLFMKQPSHQDEVMERINNQVKVIEMK